jgi:hypothetical protein
LAACLLALSALLVSALLTGCSDSPPPEVGSPCSSLSDCRGDNNLICQDGACNVVGCETPSDCPLDATCLDKLCQPRQCDVPDSCGEGALCWQGICVENGCADKSSCGAAEVCLGSPPVCTQPPELCSDDSECPTGEACLVQKRQCVSTCAGDRDCRGQTYCLDQLCQQPCRDDIDCPGDRSCVDARCRELPDCSDQPECSGLRLYRDQLTCECVSCLQSSNCDLTGQEACTASGQCIFCPQTGTSEEDCTDRGQVYVEGCCSDCIEDADCTSTRTPYCDRGRCQSVPGVECIAQNDCDSGLVCDQGRCVQPPSFDTCEHQSDCTDGEACFADGRCHQESTSCDDCPAASRCIAERADELGTCAGCTTACDASACPGDQLCYIPDGATEGYCVDADNLPQC